MSRSSGSPAVRIACIAVAATGGALVMLGARRAGVGELFAASGRLAISMGSAGPAAMTGVLIHVIWVTFWSALYALLARRHRGFRTLVDAGLVAVVAYMCSSVAPVVAGPASTLATRENALVHLVLAFALAAGMRLARTGDDRASRRVEYRMGRDLTGQ